MNETVKKAIDAIDGVALEPIKNAVLNRLSNPFFPSVVISWVFLNWERVFIILFANINILEKIERVKSLPGGDILWGVEIPHALTFYYPLVFGVMYVILNPFISYVLFFCHSNIINKLYDSRIRGKATNILSEVSLIEAEQKKNYAKELFDAKYKAEVEDQNTRRLQSRSTRNALIEEEESLKKSITTHTTELNDLREVLQSSRDELTSLNKSIKEKQEAIIDLERMSNIHVGFESYSENKKDKSNNKNTIDYRSLAKDPKNPGWVVGWIIYESSQVQFHSIYDNREEAVSQCNILGDSFAVGLGSYRPGTDQFILKNYSLK